MKRIVRLTERDLTRIVKHIVNEGVEFSSIIKTESNLNRWNGQTGTWSAKDGKIELKNSSDELTATVYGKGATQPPRY